ncbi:MAG: YbaK/EbsC family protein [Acidimicrobiia bacterium]
MTATPATRAAADSGIAHEVVEYGRVNSVEEAAEKRGVEVHRVLKSIVVRKAESEHLMVLVPGDRVIDWAKLRKLAGVSRMSLAEAEEAFEVTGYRPGAITPFGSKTPLPVIADATIEGLASLGGGVHGVAIHLDAADLIRHFAATVADVTKLA